MSALRPKGKKEVNPLILPKQAFKGVKAVYDVVLERRYENGVLQGRFISAQGDSYFAQKAKGARSWVVPYAYPFEIERGRAAQKALREADQNAYTVLANTVYTPYAELTPATLRKKKGLVYDKNTRGRGSSASGRVSSAAPSFSERASC